MNTHHTHIMVCKERETLMGTPVLFTLIGLEPLEGIEVHYTVCEERDIDG